MERFEQLEARMAQLEQSMASLMALVLQMRAGKPKRQKSRSRKR